MFFFDIRELNTKANISQRTLYKTIVDILSLPSFILSVNNKHWAVEQVTDFFVQFTLLDFVNGVLSKEALPSAQVIPDEEDDENLPPLIRKRFRSPDLDDYDDEDDDHIHRRGRLLNDGADDDD